MDPINQQSRFDCLWYGTVFWFLAAYCGSGAYSALTLEPTAGNKFMFWFLAGSSVILGIIGLGEYKNAVFGRTRQ